MSSFQNIRAVSNIVGQLRCIFSYLSFSMKYHTRIFLLMVLNKYKRIQTKIWELRINSARTYYKHRLGFARIKFL